MDNPTTEIVQSALKELTLSKMWTEADSFAFAQRLAKPLSESTMVPKQYQGSLPNCMIALELADRTGSGVMAVMQNVDIINGRPSWSSGYIIAIVDTCGLFEGCLNLDVQDLGEITHNGKKIRNLGCRAWAKRKSDGKICESMLVTVQLAIDEGWYNRTGSKWPTMPENMVRYRAASNFGKFYIGHLLLGMPTQEEVRDGNGKTEDGEFTEVKDGIAQLNQKTAVPVKREARPKTSPIELTPKEEEPKTEEKSLL